MKWLNFCFYKCLFVVCLIAVSSVNVYGYEYPFLYDSYVSMNVFSESDSSTHYIKYNLNIDGTGEELHVKLSINKDKAKILCDSFPMTWRMDNTILSIETKRDGMVTFNRYYVEYCGAYLDQIVLPFAHTQYKPLNFAACSPDFANPEILKRNASDARNLITEFNAKPTLKLQSKMWPWKARAVDNWDSGVYTVGEIYKKDGMTERISVSKDSMEYILIAPPHNNNASLSKLSTSWEILSRMSPGQKVNLSLEEVIPEFVAMQGYDIQGKSSDNAFGRMLPLLYYNMDNEVYACNNRVYGFFQATMDSIATENIKELTLAEEPVAFFYEKELNKRLHCLTNTTPINDLYLLNPNHTGSLMVNISNIFSTSGKYELSPQNSYSLKWEKTGDMYIFDLYLGNTHVGRQFFKESKDGKTLTQQEEYSGMHTITIRKIAYSTVLDGSFLR